MFGQGFGMFGDSFGLIWLIARCFFQWYGMVGTWRFHSLANEDSGSRIARWTMSNGKNDLPGPNSWVCVTSGTSKNFGMIHSLNQQDWNVRLHRSWFIPGMSSWFSPGPPASNELRSEWSMKVPMVQARWSMMSSLLHCRNESSTTGQRKWYCKEDV